ncbi:MAG: glycosyltransferase family 4 protein [Treponemataceae bacterium]
MKLIIFGTGNIYKNTKNLLKDDIEIVALVDNNSNLWGTSLDGYNIYSPKDLSALAYDFIFISTLKFESEIIKQLFSLGIKKEKIIPFYEKEKIIKSVCYYGNIKKTNNKKIVVFSHALTSTGANNVMFNAACVLKENNFDVIVLSSYDGVLKEKLLQKDIVVGIMNDSNIIPDEVFDLLKSVDFVLVNTLLLFNTVLEISKKQIKLLWWIHESGTVKDIDISIWKTIMNNNYVKTYVVSNKVKNIINSFYKEKYDLPVLTFGLDDCNEKKGKTTEKFIFANIAAFHHIKGQDLLIKAIAGLPDEVKKNTEFWFVGPGELKNAFETDIFDLAKNEECIKIKGEYKNNEMYKIYNQIDVVLVCSREEALSVVAIEGAIHNRISIVSDSAGISDYITDSKDGFVYPTLAINKLNEKILWCFNNKKRLEEMGKLARKNIFEKNFSMKVFSANLLKALKTLE